MTTTTNQGFRPRAAATVLHRHAKAQIDRYSNGWCRTQLTKKANVNKAIANDPSVLLCGKVDVGGNESLL
jgi:hypothetical protein